MYKTHDFVELQFSTAVGVMYLELLLDKPTCSEFVVNINPVLTAVFVHSVIWLIAFIMEFHSCWHEVLCCSGAQKRKVLFQIKLYIQAEVIHLQYYSQTWSNMNFHCFGLLTRRVEKTFSNPSELYKLCLCLCLLYCISMFPPADCFVMVSLLGHIHLEKEILISSDFLIK